MGIGWAGWVEPIEFIGGSADPDPLGTWLSDLSAGEWADWDFSAPHVYTTHMGNVVADANGAAIGLVSESAQWGGKSEDEIVAAAPEVTTALSPNNASVTIENGVVTYTNSVTSHTARQLDVLTIGHQYKSTFRMVSYASGGVAAYHGTGGVGPTASAPGVTVNRRPAASNATFSLTAIGASVNAVCDSVSVKHIPGFPASQTSTTDRPTYSISGSRVTATGDAVGDNMLTGFLASSGENSIIIDADVPATLAATQMIAGLSGSSTARLSIGINTSGQLVASVGDQTSTTILGSTDWRGQRLVACLSIDGDTVRLMAASVEYEDDQDGAPSTTIPLRLLATNNNGTAAGFFGGGVKRVIHAHKAMSAAAWGPIQAQLAAAA